MLMAGCSPCLVFIVFSFLGECPWCPYLPGMTQDVYKRQVLCGGYEFLVQDYHHFEVGAEVGLLVKPFDIHIMKKERVCNTFEGKLLDATHVEFLGCNFECVPVEGIAFDTNVDVYKRQV